MSADVTLVNLNMLFVRYVDRAEREIHLPLGPLYVAAALERAGLEVDFRDYQSCDARELLSEASIGGFLEGAADILFVSCMANLLPFTVLALRRYRAANPDAFIALGGVGPASIERPLLEAFPWIDAIAVGEGERTSVALARAVKEARKSGSNPIDLSAVPGIVWRRGGEIVSNPRPPRIEQLDGEPLPAWHLLDLSRYRGMNMISSRGCPYPCTFCSVAPIWGRRPLLRSADSIAAEMASLHELCGAELFLFQDEYFVSSAARVKEVCRAIRGLGFPARWKAFGRIDLTDPATMQEMAEAGCVEIRYGVESGCAEVLSRTRKGFTPEQALDVLSLAVGIFPGVDAFYMWGFPFEDRGQFQQTLLHMIAARAMGVRILPSLLALLPQTTIYEELKGSARLEFCPELFPEYMLTGCEVCDGGRMRIADEHCEVYDLVASHPELFPGFFHVDVEHNILPKYRLLQKFGFYSSEGRTELLGSDIDCCGAHSP
ncbi:MAG TPA: radical SAM protein [Polyangiaceae bacterium]|nr:radical SAM protein [Polyangiaceae bacterium]